MVQFGVVWVAWASPLQAGTKLIITITITDTQDAEAYLTEHQKKTIQKKKMPLGGIIKPVG